MEEFPPLAATEESTSAPTGRVVHDDNDIVAEEDPMDEHEDFNEGSDTSQGQRSTMSASTAGQSVVTFAQIAQRQAYEVSEEANAIMHHSNCEDEEMKYHTTSSMAKLEKKTKKAQKKSSLVLALPHSELDKSNDEESQKIAAMRGPIRPPERDSAGQIITPFTVQKPPPATAVTRRSSPPRRSSIRQTNRSTVDDAADAAANAESRRGECASVRPSGSRSKGPYSKSGPRNVKIGPAGHSKKTIMT
jgi:hypothetical protein